MDPLFQQRLICLAVIDNADDAVPLAQALLAGGLNCIEVILRTDAATAAIQRIRREVPAMFVGAGTVLTPYQAAQAAQAGAQFLVAPALDEAVLTTALGRGLPYIPGVLTPTEVVRAFNLKCKLLKFYPAEASGGVAMLKTLITPFAQTGVQFVPVGGITPATLPGYLALPQVAAVAGSWLADHGLVANHAWDQITALAAQAVKAAPLPTAG